MNLQIAQANPAPPIGGQTAPEDVAAQPDIQELMISVRDSAISYIKYFAEPWALYQILIVVGLYLVATAMAGVVKPTFERYIRQITTRPAMLPVLVVLLNRIKWINAEIFRRHGHQLGKTNSANMTARSFFITAFYFDHGLKEGGPLSRS